MRSIVVILLSEDLERISTMEKLLGNYCSNVDRFEAKDEEQAISILEHQEKVDLILSDKEVFKIGQIKPDLPVIHLSENFNKYGEKSNI